MGDGKRARTLEAGAGSGGWRLGPRGLSSRTSLSDVVEFPTAITVKRAPAGKFLSQSARCATGAARPDSTRPVPTTERATTPLSRPARYHLLLLPDGAWDTVECLAAMIRHHATVPTVIIDVSPVDRLNIDALAILIRKAMRLHSVGGELLLAGPTPAVLKLIERTGTACMLRTPPGTAAAVRYLARDGRVWRPIDLAEGQGTLFTDLPKHV